MSESKQVCIYCEADSNQIPLIPFTFREKNYWICPQHLPILIHRPGQLVGKLPGAENMRPTLENEE